MFLDSGSRSTRREPTHTRGERANSTQNGPSQELNLEPSRCEITVLTTTPPCCPFVETVMCKRISLQLDFKYSSSHLQIFQFLLSDDYRHEKISPLRSRVNLWSLWSDSHIDFFLTAVSSNKSTIHHPSNFKTLMSVQKIQL